MGSSGTFQGSFCAAAGAAHVWSSNESWAESDLWTYARKAAQNAPLFIEALYDACESFSGDDPDKFAPERGNDQCPSRQTRCRL